ncbi:MAG TPA: Gfo/Idh/MocA family oxidoreductase [Gemmatimonadaceae bacterium]|nr:Gfo/Idh/MocA family oxidoreductase [Gemmatimonadaceae bacterium]
MAPSESKQITRREFVADAAKAAAAIAVAPTIVPRHVLGRGFLAPSDTLAIGCVGIGGMGLNNMNELAKGGERIVAICDVDFPYVERSIAGRFEKWEGKSAEDEADATRIRETYSRAAKYADFREMLAKQKDLDAVVVATPDHMHATIAHAAMKSGKHVYVQKPLTATVYESRLLARTAKETGVVTQMGNQGHSHEGTRRIVELIGAGVIGPVREVHVWTDRPQRYWAQGIPRPGSGKPRAQATESTSSDSAVDSAPKPPRRWSMRTVDNAILAAMAEDPHTPPPGLNWELFLGAVKDVPYHPVYHPFSWRGWVDFGVSAIGDMGAHLMDQPFWALGLEFPTSIISTSTPWGSPASDPGSYPLAMTTRYEFAARGSMPALSLTWYDGGLSPFVAPEIPRPGGDGGGGIFIGEKGFLTYETYGDNPKVYPESLAGAAAAVPKKLPRIDVPHEINWARACKGVEEASAPFEYSARLTETMLLGVVALKAGQGRQLLYDGAAMSVKNLPEANAYLTREYRTGWEL